jgi:hypothetical protein
MPVTILGNLERHDTVVHDAILGSEALKKTELHILIPQTGQLMAPLKPDVRPRHEQIVRHVGRRVFFAQKWADKKIAAEGEIQTTASLANLSR